MKQIFADKQCIAILVAIEVDIVQCEAMQVHKMKQILQ
jgi:hypothetical protein